MALQPSNERTNTLRRIYIPIQTYKTDIREDTNTHKMF